MANSPQKNLSNILKQIRSSRDKNKTENHHSPKAHGKHDVEDEKDKNHNRILDMIRKIRASREREKSDFEHRAISATPSPAVVNKKSNTLSDTESDKHSDNNESDHDDSDHDYRKKETSKSDKRSGSLDKKSDRKYDKKHDKNVDKNDDKKQGKKADKDHDNKRDNKSDKKESKKDKKRSNNILDISSDNESDAHDNELDEETDSDNESVNKSDTDKESDTDHDNYSDRDNGSDKGSDDDNKSESDTGSDDESDEDNKHKSKRDNKRQEVSVEFSTLPKTSINKLAKTAGIKTISKNVYDIVRNKAGMFLYNILKNCAGQKNVQSSKLEPYVKQYLAVVDDLESSQIAIPCFIEFCNGCAGELNMSVKNEAIFYLHNAIENYIITLFKKASDISQNARRSRVTDKDIELASH